MITTFRIDDYKRMSATMTITLTMEDWIDLQKAIKQDYPGWKFSSAIQDVIFAASKHFEKEHKEIK